MISYIRSFGKSSGNPFEKTLIIGIVSLILVLILSIFSVLIAQSQINESTLVKIDYKNISLNEFIERSGFTVRPANLKDKRSVLNNLISEKILALEAEKQNNKVLSNTVFQAKMKGIREQAMRDVLHQQESFNKIQLDSNEIDRYYRNSFREYELEFYVINSDSTAAEIRNDLSYNLRSANRIFKTLENSAGKKPFHRIKFLDPDDEILSEALFSALLDTGAVIGPLRINNGDNIIMRVTDWIDYPVTGYEDQKIRWTKVAGKIQSIIAGKQWHSYVNRIMENKKITFHQENFKILSQMAFEHYRKTSEDSLNLQLNEITLAAAKLNDKAPVFIVGNTPWSFSKFKAEVLSHPLVYNTKKLTANNFYRNFEQAVVDMMRDHYLTDEAYKRNYDSEESVRRTVELWKDFYLAIQQQNEIINSALAAGKIKENDNSGKIQFWETYLNSLRKAHENKIEINCTEYDKIELPGIDVIVMRSGVPYPLAVPAFPRFVYSDDADFSYTNRK